MSCNSCAKSFSFFRKEKGCPGCGFSYCSNCLNNKSFVAKLNAEVKVCIKCKRLESTPNEEKIAVEPPDAYYKRLGTTPNQQETTNSNMNPKDDLILERLQKLKEDRDNSTTTSDSEIKNRLQNIKGETPSISTSEIQERLARLRGVPVETLTSKPVLVPVDSRTEQEQANDLMKQYMEETSINTKYKDEFDGVINDIEQRMQKLKGTEPGNIKGEGSSQKDLESEDEEEIVKKIIQKVKAETSLEDDEIPSSSNYELPFCEICNEDAKMRCLGCKYLFCKTCFNEHKDDDDGCNRYEHYEAPKQANY